MCGKTCYEVASVKSFGNYGVEQHHYVCHLVLESKVGDAEIVVGVKLIEVFYYLLICNVALTVARCLVEYRQCVAHASVRFLCYECKSFLLISYTFLLSHHFQMVDGVLYGHPFKVVYLASGDDCRQNLVLLCRGKNEYNMCGRFLKSLQKCVERCGGQHVHLVYDEHLVASHLRRYPCLVHKRLDVFHRVVARGVKFEDVV